MKLVIVQVEDCPNAPLLESGTSSTVTMNRGERARARHANRRAWLLISDERATTFDRTRTCRCRGAR